MVTSKINLKPGMYKRNGLVGECLVRVLRSEDSSFYSWLVDVFILKKSQRWPSPYCVVVTKISGYSGYNSEETYMRVIGGR